MDREQELGFVRRAYAREIMAAVGVSDPRVETAFAELRREDFLGPGPWLVVGSLGDYIPTASADLAFLYLDHVVGILPERHLNNGQPSLHATLIVEASPQAGEHVVHIGAGTGYYTAIMAQLVGPSGKVTGIELDLGLAERARDNLSSYPDADVVSGNGAAVPFETADVIYVNAGATRPVDAWLDGLSEGGRLILPLTTNRGFTHNDPPVPIERRGAVFRIERCGEECLAKWISAVAIFPCEGARDAESERALAAALEKGGWGRVTRLYRHSNLPNEECWLKAPDWCLAYT
jgi:protein-L-isoaspartate(D-aspartate) O-methyltransferase